MYPPWKETEQNLTQEPSRVYFLGIPTSWKLINCMIFNFNPFLFQEILCSMRIYSHFIILIFSSPYRILFIHLKLIGFFFHHNLFFKMISHLSHNLKLTMNDEEAFTDGDVYRRLVGRLLYLTIIRSALSYTMQVLSKFL